MLKAVVIGLISGLLAVAASPVATVTSAASFRISGAAVPVDGVPDWPLAAGDELVMGKAPGMVRFRDGTELYVLPNSRLKLEGSPARPAVRLLNRGGLAYRFTKNSSVEISALSKKVSPRDSTEGRLWFESGEAWWYPVGAEFIEIVSEVRRAGEPIEFQSRRITPVDFIQVPAWRNFNPPWATKPGQPAPPPEEWAPPERPGPPFEPPGPPPWVSPHRP